MHTPTIGQMVAQDYRVAGVFRRYGIDFCCRGGRTLADVCAEKGLDLADVEQALSELQKEPAPRQLNAQDWKADFLADYIEQRHHTYVRKMLPEISAYAEKVAKVHGKHHPETLEIWKYWQALAAELASHLLKEERMLFPYIRQLANASASEAPAPPFGTVQNPVRMMEMEHENAGEMMRTIRTLSHDFSPPQDACMTYRVLYQLLEAFEADLHEHVHLENNILFGKAIALEDSIERV